MKAIIERIEQRRGSMPMAYVVVEFESEDEGDIEKLSKDIKKLDIIKIKAIEGVVRTIVSKGV